MIEGRKPRSGITAVPPAWGQHRGWLQLAACRDEDPELFFQEGNRAAETLAKLVCARCPVTQTCLSLADHLEKNSIERNKVYGVWGGQTSLQRRSRRMAARWTSGTTSEPGA